MNRRPLEEHRAAVERLLAPLAENRASETLVVSPARLAARPGDYRGRVLAADVLSPTDLPSFDNSQMDGYAVSWFDLVTASPEQPVALRVAPQIAAGEGGAPLVAGTAAPIMTGAPVPAGADAIVPIEQAVPPVFPDPDALQLAFDLEEAGAPGVTTEAEQPGGSEPDLILGSGVRNETTARPSVSFTSPVTPGAYVRRTGSDVQAGAVLLPEGSTLGAAQLGVVAGTGLTEVEVVKRLRVLLVSTGHEIRDAGSELAAGQIYDSNSVALSTALIEAGCEVTAVACRSDDAPVLLGILNQHGPEADLIITVGGVSAGAREVVRDALAPLGVEFRSVAMQPGGPQGLGLAVIPSSAPSTPLSRPTLCLPGNPVSALVSFEMFVRPVLRRFAQFEPAERVREVAMLAEAVDSPAETYQVRRGFVREDGTVALIGGPSSHLLHSYASSNALVHIPAEVTHLDTGDPVMVWRIDD
ncbi:molybdopterin molybdenumtransferase MoeA [Subtercola sp. Z020]|uniref:molybdopterin molybdotransferase MoeA n=1 Tax=Subtercola sp. Z020 TaxID=2080582 RepID=UPI000CE7BE8B|nr:gephyrin-like molybdotransferase Glp [Subtercola sp. Z020]PPF84500.1 molybdopterin molybdenumtransferase MoeA [Subtercola sp. Z020]